MYKNYIKRLKLNKLRRIMRGYRALKQSGQIDRISKLKESLTENSLNISREKFSMIIYGEQGFKCAELITRQYLLLRIGGINLNRALLYSLGKKNSRVIFPLPKNWIEQLSSHGFKVNKAASLILWNFYLITALGYGFTQYFRIGFSRGMRSRSFNSEKPPEKYVYFHNLVKENLPIETSGKFNIINWYLLWSEREVDIECIKHSVRNVQSIYLENIAVKYQDGPIPGLLGLVARTKFLLWGIATTMLAAIDLLRGHWWHALLLNQSATMHHLLLTKNYLLAKEYFFHNSSWLYRPLWTYEAESRGASISLYFYSTNCEGFKVDENQTPIPYGWRAMSWSRYLVWDECQAEFVRRAIGKGANIVVAGEIWFQDSLLNLSIPPKNYIAIFDIQPVRRSFYESLGLGFEYYVSNIAIKFLADIKDIANDINLSLILKRKREIGGLIHPSYEYFMQLNAGLKNYFEAPPELNAKKIIQESLAVISMPYTSTALLAKFAGVPSVYYDPTGLLCKDDPAAHGIPILSGRLELEQWLRKISAELNANGAERD